MSTRLEKRTSAAVERAERTTERPCFQPYVDIHETPEALVVRADMPGSSAGDIDIQFENGMLSIHGRVAPRQPAGTTYLLEEYAVGDFHRTFEVGESVDSGSIAAEYAHGVLTLRLPKAAASRPRRISVTGR